MVSGGHRQGTHSVLGLGCGVVVAAVFGWIGGVPLGLYLAFLAALALSALRLRLVGGPVLHTVVCLVLGAVLTITAVWRPPAAGAVVVAVGLGLAAHIVGDCLTREGCPLLWPFSPRRLSLLGVRTDSPIERYLIGPGLVLIAIVMASRLVDVHSLYELISHGVDHLAVLAGVR